MRKLLGIEEVCRRTSRSRSTILRYLQSSPSNFPKPVRLGPRDRGWYEDEIQDWINNLPRVAVGATAVRDTDGEVAR